MCKQLPLSIHLRVDATFSSFYQSSSNVLAVSALKEFCHSSDESVFFLAGASGSGVTHLLHAAQHQCSETRIQFLPLKECIHYPAADVLTNLELLDFVVIDDVHLVSGREEWEHALFHLYNRLKDNNKKLLMGSHAPPRELTIQLPDLYSRLQWGLVYQLQRLNDEDKKHAIIVHAQALGLSISHEVMQFIFNHCGRDLHDLMAVLYQLDHASLAEKRHITVPFVKKVLQLTS